MDGANNLFKWDKKMFGWCRDGLNQTIYDLEDFWHKLIKAIGDFDIKGVYYAFADLYTEFTHNIASCKVALWYGTHLLELIGHFDWMDLQDRLLLTAITNAFSIFENIIGIVTCTFSLRPKCVGESIGELAYLFLFH